MMTEPMCGPPSKGEKDNLHERQQAYWESMNAEARRTHDERQVEKEWPVDIGDAATPLIAEVPLPEPTFEQYIGAAKYPLLTEDELAKWRDEIYASWDAPAINPALQKAAQWNEEVGQEPNEFAAPANLAFYPTQSTDERARGVRPSLHEWVFQAIGAASTCWDDDGVFLEEIASDIGYALLAEIQRRLSEETS